MNDKVEALRILSETILKNIKHQDYDHVTKLAEEYYEIFTGSNVKKHLRQIQRRESNEMFEQRCNIYQTTIPSVVENLEQLFNKPLRSNRIYSSVEHPSNDAYNEIIDRMSKFYQGESESGVDAYLREAWKRLSIYDPNAFICVEFNDFDYTREKPYPFALEYSSKEVVRHNYINGTLDWMIVQLHHVYLTNEKGDTENGYKYIMYIADWAIVLTQVHKDKKLTDIPNPVFHEIKDEKGQVDKVFVLQEYETKSGVVPAFRAGYKTDPITKGRTCVSIIHAALPFFKKELKTGSEFDLTMSLHAFPIRSQWGKACPGDKQKGILCTGGRTADGKTCPVCKGESMVPIATSTQDIIYVKPPKTKDDPITDVAKAFAYITPPVEFIKFQESFVDRLGEKAKAAVFPRQDMERKSADKTATELDYSYDNVYDVYHPFGNKYSYAWSFIVRQIAQYLDNNSPELKIYHQFPKDFKLKGLNVLLNEAKLAKESGLSQHAVNAINNDVIEALYADDQNTLTKIRVKDKFHPFSGKSPEELQTIMMSGDIIPYYKTLYQYFDVIFDEIDNESGDKFYLMTFDNQKKIVKSKVDALQKEIANTQAKAFNTAIPALEQNVEEEGE